MTVQQTVRRPDVDVWIQAELDALSRSLASPGAWRCFLRHSFARRGRNGREWPKLQRSLHIWLLLCSAASATCQMGARRRLPTARSLSWLVGATLMADWHLGMIPTRRTERLGGANRLTLIRAFLPAAFVGLPSRESTGRVRRAACMLAICTDLADGRIARRGDGCTHFGAVADPLVDGLFWTALAWNGRGQRFGRSIAWLATARFVGPLTYALVTSFSRGRTFDWERTRLGRGTATAVSALIILRTMWQRDAPTAAHPRTSWESVGRDISGTVRSERVTRAM